MKTLKIICQIGCLSLFCLSAAPTNVIASIIYFDIDDVHIGYDCLPVIPSGPPSFYLDMNNDSISDFILSAVLRDMLKPDEPTVEQTFIETMGNNRTLIQAGTYGFFMTGGAFIESNTPPNTDWLTGNEFQIHAGIYDWSNPVPCGVNFIGDTGFLGVELDIEGNPHYGWLRITKHPTSGAFILRDYAYESEPGVGIIAGAIPEPSTVFLFALGGAGLLWRARKKYSSKPPPN